MNTKQAYCQEVKNRIAAMTSWLNDTDWIPDIPTEWQARVSASAFDGCLTIGIPYNRQMYRTVEEHLGLFGFAKTSDETDEAKIGEFGYPAMGFEGPNGKQIWVSYSERMPGSTCRRRRIGTRMTEEPVFEFSCEEE